MIHMYSASAVAGGTYSVIKADGSLAHAMLDLPETA